MLRVYKDNANARVDIDNVVAPTAAEVNEQQPQQQRNVFLGAEDVSERLARGEKLSGDNGVIRSTGKAGVFYNRVGAINRDLSVLMANVLAEERMVGRDRRKKKRRRMGPTPATSATVDNNAAFISGETSAGEGDAEKEGLVVLDAFAASGVRALRCDVTIL